MRKLLGILLAMTMLLSVTACKTEGTATTAATTKAEVTTAATTAEMTEADTTAAPSEPVNNVAGKTLGFINAGPDDYYAQFGDAFKAIAGLYDMKVIEVNSDYKPEKELSNVQDMIAQGVDAIAVITTGAAGSAASIAAADAAGVPIFFIAGKPELEPGTDLTGHVTDNFVMMGYMIGQWVAENYPDAVCVNMPGFLGQGPAEGEIVGFQMALDEAGMGTAELLKSGEWQRTLAIPITQDLIASGKDFDVIFAANEEEAFGILQVFEELGVTDKVIVSNNGKDDVWAYLEAGTIAATVPNPPSLNADLCVQQIVRHFNGEPFTQYLQIKPPFVLTKDNIDQAIPWTVSDYLAKRDANTIKWELSYYEEQYEMNKDQFAEFDQAVADYLANQ